MSPVVPASPLSARVASSPRIARQRSQGHGRDREMQRSRSFDLSFVAQLASFHAATQAAQAAQEAQRQQQLALHPWAAQWHGAAANNPAFRHAAHQQHPPHAVPPFHPHGSPLPPQHQHPQLHPLSSSAPAAMMASAPTVQQQHPPTTTPMSPGGRHARERLLREAYLSAPTAPVNAAESPTASPSPQQPQQQQRASSPRARMHTLQQQHPIAGLSSPLFSAAAGLAAPPGLMPLPPLSYPSALPPGMPFSPLLMFPPPLAGMGVNGGGGNAFLPSLPLGAGPGSLPFSALGLGGGGGVGAAGPALSPWGPGLLPGTASTQGLGSGAHFYGWINTQRLSSPMPPGQLVPQQPPQQAEAKSESEQLQVPGSGAVSGSPSATPSEPASPAAHLD